MMIRKLTASFGKLENETLHLHDGLNVIYAPNESGKSTWCAFIRSMLYGIDSSERSRAGHLPDKLRYAPWSGAPMEGSMDLTADRCDITITRSTRSKNAPMREFTATYTGTNVPVEGMNGQNAGELLTGVSKDVFRRSAFIGQGTLAVTGSPELEKRISAIVASGEEETSYTEADERLRAWQRKRRYNRKGMLPELEGRMDEVQQRLNDMGTSVEDVQKLEAELEQQRTLCEQLERQVIDSRRQQRRQALEQLNLGRENVRQRSQLHDTALEELDLRRQALRSSDFGDRSPQQLEDEVDRDWDEYEDLSSRREQNRALLPTILFFVLAALAAAFYGVNRGLWLILGAVVFCAAALFFLLRYSKARQAQQRAQERQTQILRKYKVSDIQELEGVLQKNQSLHREVAQAAAYEQQSREAYEQARAQQNALEETAISQLDFISGNSEAAQLSRALTAARARTEQLSAQIAKLNGRLSAMGDPLVLASSL